MYFIVPDLKVVISYRHVYIVKQLFTCTLFYKIHFYIFFQLVVFYNSLSIWKNPLQFRCLPFAFLKCNELSRYMLLQIKS